MYNQGSFLRASVQLFSLIQACQNCLIDFKLCQGLLLYYFGTLQKAKQLFIQQQNVSMSFLNNIFFGLFDLLIEKYVFHCYSYFLLYDFLDPKILSCVFYYFDSSFSCLLQVGLGKGLRVTRRVRANRVPQGLEKRDKLL